VPKAALDLKSLDELIARALAEDIGSGDVTTEILVSPKLRTTARLVARQPGILAGMPVVRRLLERFDRRIKLSHALKDGSALKPGTVIAVVSGPASSIITVERTMLNFLQHLSGIATATRRYVDAVAGTGVQILDTRKTVPGLRALAKHAVRVGGGKNHRMGLYDRVLIKDNHLAASGLSPFQAVDLAMGRTPMDIEVEVETVQDARWAVIAEIVMLDNMSVAQMKKAVAVIRAAGAGTIVEASGGITLKNVARVARTGVDWISVGAITHSAPALDIALDMDSVSRRS